MEEDEIEEVVDRIPLANPSFPSGPEALWAGGQRGEIEERFLQRGAKGSNIYPLN
jgi:hypothetical protein